MFWGLIMEPGKKYSQVVEKSFHVSHAALDLTTAQNDAVQVMLGFDDRNYLICTLLKGRTIQTPLDLNFQAGDKISFATNGPGHVHLTGYLVPEDDFMNMSEEADSEAEEAEDEQAADLTRLGKRKAAIAIKKEIDRANNKKQKTLQESDSDDTDDSDVNMSDLLTGEAVSEEESESEEAGEEVDEEESDDSSDGQEEETPVKQAQQKTKGSPKNTPKQNGIAKTPQQQQQQTKQKGDKTPKGQKSPAGGGGNSTPLAKRTVEGGVVVEDIKVGDGAAVKQGKLVQVYYEGRLKANNKMFDSSTKGPGFKFKVGKQEVIKGWDVGLLGMKEGGKRRITCPPHMAYGAQGSPPVIPPNSTLVFEIVLKNVK